MILEQLVSSGTLRAQFDQNSKIDVLDFVTVNHSEYLPRAQLKTILSSFSPPDEKSPKHHKGAKQKAPQRQPTVSMPDAQVNSFGVTDDVMNFLEVCPVHLSPPSFPRVSSFPLLLSLTTNIQLAETISQMQPLFQFSHVNSSLAPAEALNELVANFHAQSQFGASPMNLQHTSVNVPMQQLPPGVVTPTMIPHHVAVAGGGGANHQFHVSASPSAAHLVLPGSPHIMQNNNSHPSPGPNNNNINNNNTSNANNNNSSNNANGGNNGNAMQTPGLTAQHSQQGTNSSQGASANTSPNVQNKRRRPSGVKVDGDEGGGGGVEVNGTGTGANAGAGPGGGGGGAGGTGSGGSASVAAGGAGGSNKVKPSPRLGGKRQKGAQA